MTDTLRTRGWLAVVFFVATFWLATVLGVSFLATTAKFLAPSLTLPVALDVGRYTFAVLNKVEWGLAALLLLVVLAGMRSAKLALLGAAVAVACVVLETAWLLPVLDQRTDIIIGGGQPPRAAYHQIFVYLQGLKLAALAAVIWASGLRLVRV